MAEVCPDCGQDHEAVLSDDEFNDRLNTIDEQIYDISLFDQANIAAAIAARVLLEICPEDRQKAREQLIEAMDGQIKLAVESKCGTQTEWLEDRQ